MTTARPVNDYLNRFSSAIDSTARPDVCFQGPEQLPSAFPVTDFAAASIANAGIAARRLSELHGAQACEARIVVDRRLASLWFGTTIRPAGWELPAQWDPIAGNYRAGDRFVRLHTNAPAHREAALEALGFKTDHDVTREQVAAAVSGCDAFELHEAVVAAGGVAAAMRTRDEWLAHPQGRAIAIEPLVHHSAAAISTEAASVDRAPVSYKRPLAGVRVLDLTRVLAGPVSTRFLAGLGADVLRIDPPTWNEPGTVPEVNLGKRAARLDLTVETDRAIFEELIATADIFVHGYRLGALDGLGYGEQWRRGLNPGLVDVSLNAYGHAGPWAERRGFDSVVQVAGGIAATGMEVYGADAPKPLPVQALDHATGYTMAACALTGWSDRLETGVGSTWKTSLAAHAEVLCSSAVGGNPDAVFEPMTVSDENSAIEMSTWGDAYRALPPLALPRLEVWWDTGACDHGTSSARWL